MFMNFEEIIKLNKDELCGIFDFIIKKYSCSDSERIYYWIGIAYVTVPRDSLMYKNVCEIVAMNSNKIFDLVTKPKTPVSLVDITVAQLMLEHAAHKYFNVKNP